MPTFTHLKKRIIVCCDGTWMDSDGEHQIPSNVTRICRCLRQEGIDEATGNPIPQLIYYQSGVGTDSMSLYNKYVGGATGMGLSEHIREAYSFITNNYVAGDEIFILGFSRGAFTARSIASLISAVGLLTDDGMSYFYQIFEDWEFQLKEGWTTNFPNEPWPQRPALHTPEYRRKLLELELTRADIPIKAVAVWDTVGALGIPRIGILPQPASKEYSFINAKVDKNIEYAFHALALDERRRSYAPTVWEKPAGQAWPRVLKQTWFPGVHSDIGGSYEDADLANITLAWMISQLDGLLAFDKAYVVKQNRLTMDKHKKLGEPVRDWGLGRIHDSMTLFFKLGGKRVRTPMQYMEHDGRTLKPTGRLLEHTGEHVHSSVRIRMGRNGRGYGDKSDSTYSTEALQGWTMHGVENSPLKNNNNNNAPGTTASMNSVVWKKKVQKSNGPDEVLEMPEDEMGDLERTVMAAWPEIYQEFASIRPGGHASAVRRSSTYPADLKQAERDSASASSSKKSGMVNGEKMDDGKVQPGLGLRVGTI